MIKFISVDELYDSAVERQYIKLQKAAWLEHRDNMERYVTGPMSNILGTVLVEPSEDMETFFEWEPFISICNRP